MSPAADNQNRERGYIIPIGGAEEKLDTIHKFWIVSSKSVVVVTPVLPSSRPHPSSKIPAATTKNSSANSAFRMRRYYRLLLAKTASLISTSITSRPLMVCS